MDETQEYFIDIVTIAPLYSKCYIQSPHEEILSVLTAMYPETDGVYKVVNLTQGNKDKLIQATLDRHIEEFIHSMEIKCEDRLLFEGYDGMEYGTISKTIKLPEWFAGKYIETKMCNISSDW